MYQFIHIPQLKRLDCHINQLTSLNLEYVPQLKELIYDSYIIITKY